MANTFFTRLAGLMFRKSLPEDSSLAIIPCNSIHCAFMRFSIDAAYIDDNGIVLRIVKSMKPWRASIGPKGSRWVLETYAESMEKFGIKEGVVVKLID